MSRATDSPIVQTVRKAREQLARDCGNDLKALLAELRRQEATWGRPTRSPRGNKATHS